MKINYLLILMSFATFHLSKAQQIDAHSLTTNHLKSNASKLNLSKTDLQELTLQTYYTDSKTGVGYAYLQQNFGGYPIYGGIATFSLKDEKITYMTENFQREITQRIGNQTAENDLNNISIKIAQNLGLTLNQTAFLNTDFNNQLFYFPTEDGKLNLSWVVHLNIKDEESLKIMEIIAHAQTGEIYSTHNQLLSCNFDEVPFENPLTPLKKDEKTQWLKAQYANSSSANDGSSYRVFKLPIEAPTFGERNLINNPAHAIASPYGWHNVSGNNGVDYTYTRGNNVIAVNDQNSEGLSWLFGSGGNYTFSGFAEGGEELTFDFPIDFTRNMYESHEASTTNLFYMNNLMHDVWYQYGFTEAAGNFQQNNYGNGGIGNDQVYAFSQTGEAIGYMNNAMFGTPNEGGNPYMIMFMWTSNQGDSHLFSVNTEGPHQGNYNGILAGFGSELPSPSITELLAVAIDDNANGGSDPNDACENITNTEDLNGKIVLIKRGSCDFVTKVKKAQNAGAKAVVMVNNVSGNPIAMGGSDPTITIPSVMINRNNGNAIIDAILDGEILEGSVPKDGHWDGYKDGSLDNGIIIHEYGHGISTRLTGGPTNGGCLNNDEQMGEGWSDYFALIMTIEPGDQATDGRGIGSYAVSQPPSGVGIRPTRYSTNMSVNPATYNTIKNVSIPHGVGYVWATMLWEMTWELIDEYGFDPDLHSGTGGNNIAMQLVIDGLKLQNCNPGFIDGRNAILQADLNNNNGVNQCRIWKAFAKRGLGYSATQGSAYNVMDGSQAFDMPPNEILNCEANMSTDELLSNEFNLYPNPSKNEFYILTDKAYSSAELSIQDLNGKLISQQSLNLSKQRASINISHLVPGIYLIKIQTKDGTITKKLIKK